MRGRRRANGPGAGLSGLWAAVQAAERHPGRSIVLVDGRRIADAASGRNGGFMQSSLTHGAGNAMARFPDEAVALERFGLAEFKRTISAIGRFGIECDLELVPDTTVALAPHELPWLAEEAELLERCGHQAEVLDGDQMRARVGSPAFQGGVVCRSGSALVDPARLCWGLARVAEELGVTIHEQSPVRRLRRRHNGVELELPAANLRAERALLATSAFRGLVAPLRRRIVPVWDYVLATEPLGVDVLAEIGWRERDGLSDMANRFHYYRLTADRRIIWGGYDAIYHYRGRVGRGPEQREETFARLAQHFFITFPQLRGIRFSHRWGGAIDTCPRFFAFQGTTHGGRVAYTAGHTGLGVGASRVGALVALQLLENLPAPAAGLTQLTSKPTPFPPEPLRWAGIELTRAELARADRNQGQRSPWLRLLDAAGLGFNS